MHYIVSIVLRFIQGKYVENSVKFRIVSRLTVEPIFKHQLEQWLHSDAADRLHLRCCGSQKITEVRCALLGSDRS